MTSLSTSAQAVRTPRCTLVCLPFAGGSSNVYRGWQAALPPQVDVLAVRLPGREDRLAVKAPPSISALADDVLRQLTTPLQAPYVLFGHSMGALLAFELARRLVDSAGTPPSLLIASACRAPQLAPSRPAVHQLPPERFITELRRLNGTPAELFRHTELLDLMLPTLYADFEATWAYRVTSQPLPCPITVLGGTRDDLVDAHELSAWSACTMDRFTQHWLEGNHFFVQDERDKVLHIVYQELRRLRSAVPRGDRGGANNEREVVEGGTAR